MKKNLHPLSGDARRSLAKVLIHSAELADTRRGSLSLRSIAEILDMPRDAVNSLIKNFESEGALKIDRHRMVLNKSAVRMIADESDGVGTYVILKARRGFREKALDILLGQPGVVMIDPVEGAADVIFKIQARDREVLDQLTERALEALRNETEDIQLLQAT